MTIKIDTIEQEQFQELLLLEGDTIPLYYIWALHFEPPRPMTDKEAIRRATLDVDEDELMPYGQQQQFAYVMAMLMKVDKPYLYKDGDGDTIYILPNDPKNKIDYNLCNVISSEHNAWCYRLSPRFFDPWDLEENITDAWWYFNPGQTVPDFNLADTTTH